MTCSSKKLGEILKSLPNVLCIADDILILGYDVDSKDHDGKLK